MQTQLPIIAVNGIIDAKLSPLDRGFSYGDGVFETCKIKNSKTTLWDLHNERLQNSCKKLFIPIEIAVIEEQLDTLIKSVATSILVDAIVKITVTRGVGGGRGYRLPNLVEPTIVIGIFPATTYPVNYFSEGITVRICQQRLSCNSALAGIKHLNRLEQVLARAEWDDETIAEGILLDTKDNLIEAIFSNIFIIKAGELLTPDLSESGVAGVMRRYIVEKIAPQQNINVRIKKLALDDLLAADEVFLCNSVYGIWPVSTIINNGEYLFKVGEVTQLLREELTRYF